MTTRIGPGGTGMFESGWERGDENELPVNDPGGPSYGVTWYPKRASS